MSEKFGIQFRTNSKKPPTPGFPCLIRQPVFLFTHDPNCLFGVGISFDPVADTPRSGRVGRGQLISAVFISVLGYQRIVEQVLFQKSHGIAELRSGFGTEIESEIIFQDLIGRAERIPAKLQTDDLEVLVEKLAVLAESGKSKNE